MIAVFLHVLLWTFCWLIYHWHSIKVISIKSEKILHCQLWEANQAITANLDRDEHIVEHALTTVPIETVNLNSFCFIKLQNLLRGRKTRRRNRMDKENDLEGGDNDKEPTNPDNFINDGLLPLKHTMKSRKYLMTTMSRSTCGVTLKNYWWQKGNMTRWIVPWCWNHTRKQWGMMGDFMFYAM